MKTAFSQYRDNEIVFTYPSNLKLEKPEYEGQYLLWQDRTGFQSLTIEIDPPEGIAETQERTILTPTAIDSEELGVTEYVYRKGNSPLLPDMRESVVISRVIHTGVISYGWNLSFRPPSRKAPVYVAISAIGDFEEDEPMWREVLESIRMVSSISSECKTRKSLGDSIKGDIQELFGAKREGHTTAERTVNVSAIDNSGQICLRSRKFTMDADHSQFYLWDPKKKPDPPVDYTEQNIDQRVHVAPYVVSINPFREMNIPVEVEIRSTRPKTVLSRWDHVVECKAKDCFESLGSCC